MGQNHEKNGDQTYPDTVHKHEQRMQPADTAYSSLGLNFLDVGGGVD